MPGVEGFRKRIVVTDPRDRRIMALEAQVKELLVEVQRLTVELLEARKEGEAEQA